jgi:hypothetical protein
VHYKCSLLLWYSQRLEGSVYNNVDLGMGIQITFGWYRRRTTCVRLILQGSSFMATQRTVLGKIYYKREKRDPWVG